MKLRTTLAALLVAAAAFTGCSNENTGDGNIPEGKAAKMGISFTLPIGAGTRADQQASDDESKVKTISVYIFDAGGVALTKGGYTHFTDIDNEFTNVSGTYTLKSANYIETLSGTGFQVYIAINHPSPTSYPNKGALIAATADVEDLCKTLPAATAKGFAMFSAQKTANFNPYDAGDPTSVTKVELPVDRVVSKLVSSTAKDTYDITWSTGLKLEYTVRAFGVYQEGIKTYLVPTTTPLNVINDYAASVVKDNIDVVDGHPALEADRADMEGFYIGENVPVSNLNGNTTYAMIATTVEPDQAAKWNTATQQVDWSTASYSVGLLGSDDIFIVRAPDGATYITNVENDANEIAGHLSGVYYTYPKGYVHFQVYLNKAGANDYKVWRNQFIHVKVNGVNMIDGFFPGYPGVPGEPDKPIDPTDPTDPNNPDPIDPTDPIDPEDALLNVEVTVKDWEYKDNSVILQ